MLHQIARDQLVMARRRHVQAGKRTISRERRLSERSSIKSAEQLIASGSTPSQHLAKQEWIQRMRQAMNNLHADTGKSF
jgi:predicted DNA-binding protein (MmcQ/YjbR family)